MRIARFLKLTALAAVFATVASCGTDNGPTETALVDEPFVAPDAGLLGSVLSDPMGLLLTCDPLPEATASATIDSWGGVLRVGPHVLYVPPGALDGPTTITAVAPSDTVNRVRFEPHGLQFKRTVYLQMSYANCDGVMTLLPKRIAYVNDVFDILEWLLSFDNVWHKRVTGRLDHFSQYAVAW